MEEVFKNVTSKVWQGLSSVALALVASFEATALFFNLALLVIVIDVLSAYMLGRRVHRKYPDRADGKFKSEYKFRILFTFIIFMLAMMAGHIVDIHIIQNGIKAQAFVVWVFIFYECWSIGENWSSENDSLLARVMQKVMVNKADRHFNLGIKEAIEEAKEELQEEQEANNE